MFSNISIVKRCALILIVLFIAESNQQNVIRRTIDIDEGNGRNTKINVVKNGNDIVVTSVSNSKSNIPSIIIPKVLPVATAAASNSNTLKTNSSRAIVPNKANDSVPSKISTNISTGGNSKQTNTGSSDSSNQSVNSNKKSSNTSGAISVSVSSNGRPVLPNKPIAPSPVESVNHQGISLSVSSNNKASLATIQNNTAKLVEKNPTSNNGVVSVSSSSSNGKHSNQNGALSVSINKPGSVSASVSSKANPSPKIKSPIISHDIWYSSEDDWNIDQDDA